MSNSMIEVKNKVNELGSAWEDFKETNDERLDILEKKNSTDPLTDNKLHKLNKEVESLSQELKDIKTAIQRPNYGDEEVNKKKQDSLDFINFLRTGISKKAFDTSSGAAGFDLVKAGVYKTIISRLFNLDPMRRLSSVIQISDDSLRVNTQDGDMETSWMANNVVADTTTATFKVQEIHTYTLYTQPKAEQRLLDDSVPDLESWITERVVDAFSRAQGNAFINGIAIGTPKGILKYSTNEITQIHSGVSADITADSLFEMFYSMEEAYKPNATFLMHNLTVRKIRLLKDTTGRYLWEPSLAKGEPETLLGSPIERSNYVPTPVADSLSVIYADFKQAYYIADRIGINMIRDAVTNKPFVKFYTTIRVGGSAVNFDAAKILKLSV